jgi:hypothetical protein
MISMLLSLMSVGMNCVGDFREQTSVTKYHTILFSEYLHWTRDKNQHLGQKQKRGSAYLPSCNSQYVWCEVLAC